MLLLLLFAASARATFDTLFDWCRNDTICSENYHITDLLQSPLNSDDRPLDSSAEVFQFLAERWVSDLRNEPRSIRDLKQIVERRFEFKHASSISDGELERSVRSHWVVLLRLSSSENRQVHCGTNERLVVSPETLDAYCDCISNRNCDDGGNWRSRWNIATLSTVAVSVLIFFYLFISIVHYGNKIHFFHEYRESQRTADETKNELIKTQ